MENAEINLSITYTERAAAVLQGARPVVTPELRSTLLSIQQWDLVRIHPCTTPLLVFSRQWSIEEHSIGLQLLLDLLPDDQPVLTVVK
jgi:hypothetical protein